MYDKYDGDGMDFVPGVTLDEPEPEKSATELPPVPAPIRDESSAQSVYKDYDGGRRKEGNGKKRTTDDKSFLDGAERDGVPRPREGALIKFAKNAIPIVVGVAVMFWWMGGGDMFSSKGPSEEALKLEDERFKAILAEREEMAKRLEIAEARMSAERDEGTKRLETMLEEFRRGREEDAKARREADARTAAIRDELMRYIEEQNKQRKKEEGPPPKTEPLTGNTAATRTFDAVGAWRDARAAEEKALAEQKFEAKRGGNGGIPMAARIPAVLETKLISLTLDGLAWAVARTTQDFELEDGWYVPAGAQFLGRAVADEKSRRMFVEIEYMQLGANELPVKGVLLDRRGSSGLVTRYIDARNQAMWAGFIPNLISAAARASQDMKDVRVTNRDTGDYYTEQRPEFSGRNVLLEGTAKSFEEQAALLRDMAKDKKNLIIVDAPLEVLVQPAERIDMGDLVAAGIAVRRERGR